MKYYDCKAVENYISNLNVNDEMLAVPEALIDTYFINHGNTIEIFKVRALDTWQSVYTRHIFKKRVPKWAIDYLNAYSELPF